MQTCKTVEAFDASFFPTFNDDNTENVSLQFSYKKEGVTVQYRKLKTRKMAQNPNNNASIDEVIRYVTEAFRNLTLAMKKIDEAKNGDEHSREFTVRQNAIRAISIPHRFSFPLPLTASFYNTLTNKLGIPYVLTEYQFHRDLRRNQTYKSPLDFVDILVSNNNATEEVVQKLFEKQYEIVWYTATRDPDQFSFYEFCESVKRARSQSEGQNSGNNVMTYKTRRAHVISRLYQTQKELLGIRGLNHEELCPPIYARYKTVDSKWATWTYKYNKETKSGTWVQKKGENIDWITNEDLKEYIKNKSKKQNFNDDCLPTNERQLYWAVFEEDDNQLRQPGEPLPCEPLPSETQVYIGKAQNGIKERWSESGTAHSKRMEFARDVMCNMLSYDPTALLREQLVDLRLLLHKACNPDGSKIGLFIMGDDFSDDKALKEAESKDIDKFRATDMKYGMNFRK